MKWTIRIAGAAALVTVNMLGTPAPTAQAAPGGNFPGPGLCDYPGVGQSGLIGIVPYYFCDFPTEANGTHWHCEAGGVSLSGGAFTFTNGLGIGGLGNFGFAFGSCYFKWPDGSLAPAPNPPGAWKNFMVPAPIPANHTAPPMPYDQTQDVAPPPVEPPPPPPCNNPPFCPPAPEAVPPPQIMPPPTVPAPILQPPVRPGESEVLPPPPTGEPVPPSGAPPNAPSITNPGNPNPGNTVNPKTAN